jgi:hypothetical protein
LRYREACNTALVQSNTETPIPDGQWSILNPVGDFPVGNRRMKGHDCLPSKILSADARCHVLSSTLHLWDPSWLATSRFLSAPFDFGNAEMPSPESSGSRATCPSDDWWLRLNRGITTRKFDVHVTLALANPDLPICKW